MQSDFYKVALFPHHSTQLSALLNSTYNEKANKWKIWCHLLLNVPYRPGIQRCTLEPDTKTLIYITMNNHVVLLTILNDDTTERNFRYYSVR